MRYLVFGLLATLLLLTSCNGIAPPLNETFKDYQETNHLNKTNNTPTKQPLQNITHEIYIPQHNTTYLIASMNLEGVTKNKLIDNKETRETITKVIKNYDFIAIQGIIDEKTFTEYANKYLTGYSYEINTPYVFLYTKDVKLSQTKNVDKAINYKLSTTLLTIKDFKTVVIQTSLDPYDAQQQIKELEAIILDAKKDYGINDVIVMGTLYSDCVYYSKTANHNDYYWYITEDTTTSKSYCVYDQIISPYNYTFFDCKVNKYTDNVDLATTISNHYPVYCEVEI